MAAINEEEQWDNEVYQLELTDPIEGGAEGIDNLPHKNLANRTTWLKTQMALLKISVDNISTLLSSDDTSLDELQELVNYMKLNKATLDVDTYQVGDIITRPVNSVSEGTLECDGSLLSRVTFSALFAEIGETFGAGDGATTFAIPDYRGEFLRAWDNGRGVDISRAIGTSQSGSNASHNHTTPNHTHPNSTSSSNGNHKHTFGVYNSDTPSSYAADGSSGGGSTASTSYDGSHNHTTYTPSGGGSSTGSAGSESKPRNVAVMLCIKY